ncbi:hypothetical protein FDK21_00505 [Cohaesibacter sp. CAU 1516]|uniref:hypothetical protein n=1 Tax=Cohaesibacter sp. CAU 1516 TaxID=2576038 RepID=UPI0010FF29CD|nr:hypothetical protein [Cohaesibacter sp. CAU 1516]TLP48184.1 hypothetical protein FDK21_00505 [Cohaesibacter sp. CAU 1516]
MLFILLGTFVAGVGAAGFIILFYKMILKRPRPKAAVPLAAGTAMILLQIVLDYGWYARATSDFDDNVVILRTAEGTSLLQPLSFIVPRTDRFLAIDKATIKKNDDYPGIRLATLFQAEKDGPTTTILQMIDCIGGKRADWSANKPLTEDAIGTANWFDIDGTDPLFDAVCNQP